MQALLSLKNIIRRFSNGEQEVEILKNIDLDIYAGEWVAIVGASGSGKSTLMNILGCLDKPSSGQYTIAGTPITQFDEDELAQLRREYFGFIFQRYQLLPELSALDNVAMPAIYSGVDKNIRERKAKELLQQLGLANKIDNKPNQLSGGQQQRVSIARALINGGNIILADEPTGALDSHSGIEVMKILYELNQQGHTVILVTHDMSLAQNADRIIEIKDGQIIKDETKQQHPENKENKTLFSKSYRYIDKLKEATKMAVSSILSHKLRSFLTMLGIIIGVGSVISVYGLGQGSKQQLIEQMSSFGSLNKLVIERGIRGKLPGFRVQTFSFQDVNTLEQLPFIKFVVPTALSNSKTVLYNSINFEANIVGVNQEYQEVENLKVMQGSWLDKQAIDNYALEAVISSQALKILQQTNTSSNLIGEVIVIGTIPVKIIGVAESAMDSEGASERTPDIWIPHTTLLNRLLGKTYYNSFVIQLHDNVNGNTAEKIITKVLTELHSRKDFTIFNVNTFAQEIETASSNLQLLITFIAIISLVVGGIGVMNIMLVSVTERTQEIGVRMAVGARKTDIMQQFLVEAVIICLLGGFMGVLIAFVFGWGLTLFANIPVIFSIAPIFIAILTASSIGIGFGFFPAKKAAGLNPIEALSRD